MRSGQGKAGDQAEKVRTRYCIRLIKRNPRTRATVGQLLDRWLQVLDVDPSTRRSYEGYMRKHIRPAFGSLPLTRLDVETLDSFYAELRQCRDHCDGRPSMVSASPSRAGRTRPGPTNHSAPR
jgi:integrase